jgi:hypothetical protein
MADLSKRTKKARKQTAKRAKAARKVAATTSTQTRMQTGLALLVAIVATLMTAKLLKRRGAGDDAAYKPQPDNLPNEPDRPVGTTPMPTAT